MNLFAQALAAPKVRTVARLLAADKVHLQPLKARQQGRLAGVFAFASASASRPAPKAAGRR